MTGYVLKIFPNNESHYIWTANMGTWRVCVCVSLKHNGKLITIKLSHSMPNYFARN